MKLVIYNIAGQRVKTLMDKAQPAGQHQISWNGTDDFGQSVGSGVFFYRLSTENQVQTRRMVLIR